MPVILTTPAEINLRLLADAQKALELQRLRPDNGLRIVPNGEREDGPHEEAALHRSREPCFRVIALEAEKTKKMTHTNCKLGPVQKQGNFGGYGFVVRGEQSQVLFSLTYDTEASQRGA
jgi:hypothetical protein